MGRDQLWHRVRWRDMLPEHFRQPDAQLRADGLLVLCDWLVHHEPVPCAQQRQQRKLAFARCGEHGC